MRTFSRRLSLEGRSVQFGRLCVAVGVLVAAPPARAVHPDDAAAAELSELRDRIDAGEAADAETRLKALLGASPDAADILNLLGYAARKQSRPAEARGLYERALAIDPTHRGALEYFGELELEIGDVAAARRLRARLVAACSGRCAELRDLDDAFAERGLSPLPGG